MAFLSVRTRDVAAAEDALSDALVRALATWPREGVPRDPEAWLMVAARRRLIDRARHERVKVAGAPTVELLVEEFAGSRSVGIIPDERLKLLFVCAHPAIDPDMHTPLMLQPVLGLDAAQIARAFVVPAATMSQRLVRAKAKIRDAGIAFQFPEPVDLPARLEAVLSAIYAAYGSGWEDAAGVDSRTNDLADEAIWLARVLAERLPEEPEVLGLLALMLYCEARRDARRARDGSFIPLSDQNPGVWNTAMIDEAERLLAASAVLGRRGRFQIEAAIQSAHVEQVRSGSADAGTIAWFYDRLVELSPTLGAKVARAAAHAESAGPERGLALLDEIDSQGAAAYQPYWAVRAHLLRMAGRAADADEALDRAIELASDDAVRRFLAGQRQP